MAARKEAVERVQQEGVPIPEDPRLVRWGSQGDGLPLERPKGLPFPMLSTHVPCLDTLSAPALVHLAPQTSIGLHDGPETQPSIIEDDEDDHGAYDPVDKQV